MHNSVLQRISQKLRCSIYGRNEHYMIAGKLIDERKSPVFFSHLTSIIAGTNHIASFALKYRVIRTARFKGGTTSPIESTEWDLLACKKCVQRTNWEVSSNAKLRGLCLSISVGRRFFATPM